MIYTKQARGFLIASSVSYIASYKAFRSQVNASSSRPGTPGSRSRTPSVAFTRPSWESLDASMLDAFAPGQVP